jgi:sugar phosphate isomerase/epimerase
LVENLTNDATTPEHLVTILDLGHLDNVGVCLDLGHANMTVGIPDAVSVLGPRIVSLHVHDNHGTRDEHLWPGDGTIDWKSTAKLLNGNGTAPAAVLEVHYTLNDAPGDIPGKIQSAWEKLAS